MYLGSMNCSIYQAHPRDPLQFSPSAAAIAFSKTGQPTDGSTNGNRLNIPNRSDEFEIHRPCIKSSFHRNFHLTPNAPQFHCGVQPSLLNQPETALSLR